MKLYCWALSFLSWLKMGWPFIDGHDYMNVDVDESGRGTLACRRCGYRSTAW